jgi:hypothetical protein
VRDLGARLRTPLTRHFTQRRRSLARRALARRRQGQAQEHLKVYFLVRTFAPYIRDRHDMPALQEPASPHRPDQDRSDDREDLVRDGAAHQGPPIMARATSAAGIGRRGWRLAELTGRRAGGVAGVAKSVLRTPNRPSSAGPSPPRRASAAPGRPHRRRCNAASHGPQPPKNRVRLDYWPCFRNDPLRGIEISVTIFRCAWQLDLRPPLKPNPMDQHAPVRCLSPSHRVARLHRATQEPEMPQ